jgi:two-component system response regulator AtoC
VADGGTLFLDELSALDLPLQAKILVAIETGRIRPVGAIEEKTVRVQLVAAMNEDPETMVREGRFREDLYHRLRVIHLHLPPLRDRGNDLMTLAEHFVSMHTRKFGMKAKSLTPEARKTLKRYHWPGNVRELCHRLESAVLLSEEAIDADVLPAPKNRSPKVESQNGHDVIRIDFSRGPLPLEQVEKEMVARALTAADHNITRAAQLLDVSRDALRHRAEKFGLTVKRSEPPAKP